jgi:hypothetical protein
METDKDCVKKIGKGRPLKWSAPASEHAVRPRREGIGAGFRGPLLLAPHAVNGERVCPQPCCTQDISHAGRPCLRSSFGIRHEPCPMPWALNNADSQTC